MTCFDVRPAIQPADVRVSTDGFHVTSPASLVRVSTNVGWQRDDWPRDEFFEWFDQVRPRAGFKNEYELARAASISHSAISGWRTGRQRPSTATLSKVAQVLGVSAREVWLRAGAMAPEDLEEGPPQPMPNPDAWGLDIIEASSLSLATKKKLKAAFLEQERQDREARARRLRNQIEFAEDLTAVD